MTYHPCLCFGQLKNLKVMEGFPKLTNPHDDSVIAITNSSFSIGRSLSCDHVIQSLSVSRFHCCIKKNNDRWTLYDRSSNGTVVNSTTYKFNESVDLKSGDVIKLAPENVEFVFTENQPNLEPIIEAAATVNNDAILEVTDPVIVEEFQQPLVEAAKTSAADANRNSDIMENELTCSICSELFIKAVTLDCSHTYCKFCIEEWKKNKSSCPICRKLINTVSPTLVLDNFIDKFMETQSDEVKETRKSLIQQRQEIDSNTASSSNVSSNSNVEVIQIYSDHDDESDYSNDYSDDEDYTDYDDCDLDTGPYVRRRGYYGGYGRCYICNQAGHWANSCPLKRR